jgi:hypothetical protein
LSAVIVLVFGTQELEDEEEKEDENEVANSAK